MNNKNSIIRILYKYKLYTYIFFIEMEKSPLLNVYYIRYSNIHAHSSSLSALLNAENTELNEASVPRPFNDGSYGVKPSLPPITINPEPVSRLSFFRVRRRGLIYNPTDVTGSRCCYARAREHLKTNEKIQEGRKIGIECVPTCVHAWRARGHGRSFSLATLSRLMIG